jgi:DNA-binding transcriptional MerR regulator
MTTTEFCEAAGLTPRELERWLEIGLLAPADMVGRTAGGGLRREFTADQAERARLLKVLHLKGVSLSRLAAVNLAVDAGQAYIVNDGHELRACRDAAAAIAAVVRAKRPCAADSALIPNCTVQRRTGLPLAQDFDKRISDALYSFFATD